MKNNIGLLYAISAYTMWGIIPIFWKQIDYVGSAEIVMHRMLWSCLFVTSYIALAGQWQAYKALFSQPKLMLRLFIASTLMSLNWAVFIWAVNNGHIVETSLGYFINPLISVLFGVVFFAEHLRKGQIFALSIAVLGVVYLVVTLGTIPWISLWLAITFSLYSVAKKTTSVPAGHGLAIETLFFIVPAIAYLVYIEANGSGHFFTSGYNAGMLALGGFFTLIPLLLFSAAAKKISMTLLGMTQYVGPSLQFLIGVLMYNEPFGSERMVAFGLVWFALLVFSIDQIRHQRTARRMLI